MRKYLIPLIFAAVLIGASVSSAQFERRWVRNQPGGLGNIHGIAANPVNGDIFISNFADIYHFNSELQQQRIIDFNVREIRGIGIDTRRNRLLCANYGESRYIIADMNGNVLQNRDAGVTLNTIDYDSDRDLLVLGDWNRSVVFIDQDFQVVSRFNVNFNITGVIYYPVNRSIIIFEDGDRMYEFSLDGQQIGVPMQNDQVDGNGQDIGYDPARRILYATGQGGVVAAFDDRYGAMPEPAFDPEAFDIILGLGLDAEETLTITNVGEERSILRFEISDVGEGVDWLGIEPTAGELDRNEEIEITLAITTARLQPERYHRDLIVSTNNPDFARVEIPVDLLCIAGYGSLTGTITDAANDRPVAGSQVLVMTRFGQLAEAFSNERGYYEFPRVPEWVYSVRIRAENYLPQVFDTVAVVEDEETVLDCALLHSRCVLSVEAVNYDLAPDENADFDVAMRNAGNGPLAWRAELDFPDELEGEQWSLRRSHPASQVTGDIRLQGITFAEDNFYIAGHAGGQKLIYVLNRNGELLRRFPQLCASNYGYADLTWDGEWLWGAGERRIYGFTNEGDTARFWDGPYNPTTCITWDPDRSQFWLAAATNDIVAYDRGGNRGRTFSRRNLRLYGLGYYPEDPDGYNLYLFTNPGNVQIIYKMNPVNGDTLRVVEIQPEGGGTPAGCHITNLYDPYSWVFLNISNVGPNDMLHIWHLSAMTGWIACGPVEGILAAGEEEVLTLTFNAQDLPVLRFDTELVIRHDGVGGSTRLPITLNVSLGRVRSMRTLDLSMGWNMISLNVDPEDPDLRAIFRTLVEDGSLQIVKDDLGRFYLPIRNFINIPGWNAAEGYQVKVTRPGRLSVWGESMLPNDPIALERGWQMAAYYPRIPVAAPTALAGVRDQLALAKDGLGNFYSPRLGFNNIPLMREGLGYQLKMAEDAELVYNLNGAFAAAALRWNTPNTLAVKHFNIEPTSENMSLLLLNEAGLSGEIGVFFGSRLAGASILAAGATGVAVWGSPDIASSDFSLKYWDGQSESLIPVEWLEGNAHYETDGLSVGRLLSSAEQPISLELQSIYPNPFNTMTTIGFTLPIASNVKIIAFDISGRELSAISNAPYLAGSHRIHWNAEGIPSGIYFVRMEATGFSRTIKTTLIR